MWKLIYLDNMNFNTELKKNIGCNIVYSSSDGGNYSIILMEFDSGNRIMDILLLGSSERWKMNCYIRRWYYSCHGLMARTIWLFESQKVVDLEIDESLNLFIEVEDGLK